MSAEGIIAAIDHADSFFEALVREVAERVRDQLRADLGRGQHEARPEYFTVAEAAEYLRAKPQRVYDLLSARRLPRMKDGTRVLIRRADLDAYLAS